MVGSCARSPPNAWPPAIWSWQARRAATSCSWCCFADTGTGASIARSCPASTAEAREDVALNTQISERKRRRRFHELLLDRRVHSVYEPIVEVGTNVVFGYEALARGPDGTEFSSPIEMFTEAGGQGLVYELD